MEKVQNVGTKSAFTPLRYTTPICPFYSNLFPIRLLSVASFLLVYIFLKITNQVNFLKIKLWGFTLICLVRPYLKQ